MLVLFFKHRVLLKYYENYVYFGDRHAGQEATRLSGEISPRICLSSPLQGWKDKHEVPSTEFLFRTCFYSTQLHKMIFMHVYILVLENIPFIPNHPFPAHQNCFYKADQKQAPLTSFFFFLN